ncbi:MAG: PmoA family protein [Bacteroidota bacterium]
MRLKFLSLSFLIFALLACENEPSSSTAETDDVKASTPSVTFKALPEQRMVEIRLDDELFTTYRYPTDIAKPILYPLTTVSGKKLTRGFPLEPQTGERTDHPHHIGYWFNYGDVNGLDFWNNSEAIAEVDKDKYGSIHHVEVVSMDEEAGQLVVVHHWKTPDDETIIEETTQFTFSQSETTRIIDRATKLKALIDVDFKDNKEGVAGIRVIQELELPSAAEDLVTLIGNDGLPSSEKQSNTAANGDYLSSEGRTGGDVWGRRAEWVKLEGTVKDEIVSLTLIDHPDNVGYPTYWHARGYGLFAANPLGQAIFSKGAERLNFKLAAGESVTFNYRLLIHNEHSLTADQIEYYATQFEGQ